MANMPATISIAIIIGSTRQPRVGPQIAEFVRETISLQAKSSNVTLNLIDLVDWNLPFFDEPNIPKTICNSDDYTHEHTRRWSREIARHDGFIFVSPQYNWGIPAPLKNSIDFLFNEWTHKAATVISYGGHGGNKCNAHLREVLAGLDMRVTDQYTELSFPSREVLVAAAKGDPINIDASEESNPWSAEQKSITTAFSQLIDVIAEKER